jgi:hypothetical protein
MLCFSADIDSALWSEFIASSIFVSFSLSVRRSGFGNWAEAAVVVLGSSFFLFLPKGFFGSNSSFFSWGAAAGGGGGVGSVAVCVSGVASLAVELACELALSVAFALSVVPVVVAESDFGVSFSFAGVGAAVVLEGLGSGRGAVVAGAVFVDFGVSLSLRPGSEPESEVEGDGWFDGGSDGGSLCFASAFGPRGRINLTGGLSFESSLIVREVCSVQLLTLRQSLFLVRQFYHKFIKKTRLAPNSLEASLLLTYITLTK